MKKNKEWWESFRWFYSSSGVLIVGGKNAESNDTLLRTHMGKGDIVFHTEDPGSPFFVIKGYADKKTMKEAGIAAASYSQGWKKGLSNMKVMYAVAEQLSKDKGMKSGTWQVKGRREVMNVKLELAIGITKDEKIIGGPVESIRKKADKFVKILPGGKIKDEIVKEITRKIDGDESEVMKFVPAGKSHIIKRFFLI